MPRGPPCGHPGCPEPQDDGGQWYYIRGDHGQLVSPGANSVCKRRDCRRYFAMLGEKKKPGPKKSGDAKLTGNERTMPSNYIVKKVHDIIGCRCARRPCPVAQPLCARVLTDCPVRVRRIANVSQLDAEERAGNALKNTVLEYAVRGHFMMSNLDKYGKHTTFYVPYKTLLRDLNDLPAELDIFEDNLRMHRESEDREFNEDIESENLGEEGEEGQEDDASS